MKSLLQSYYLKLITLTFIPLFFFCCISVAQTTRYVATTGNNGNPGTLASPYLTIAFAISASANGDTIRVATGTYTAAATTTVNKSVAIIGTGANSSSVILNRGTYATSAITGFAVTANNVTIKNMRITNYNVGIGNTAAVSNLTLDSVQLFENWGSGFYSTFGIDSLAITNSYIAYNGKSPSTAAVATYRRGIFLSTGATYAKLNFNNDTIDYNGLVGIEISSIGTTTSIDGVTITNNLVRNNLDIQISTWLGTSTPLKKAISISNNTIILSGTARYGIDMRNPAGNGKTSGVGSVVISNNTISVVSHTGSARDMAAIGVIRRKENSAVPNDQPQGVVVSGNTISDFQNPGAGDAYGIVFGGTGHKAFDNIISNTEYSIQLQKGNTGFGANTNSPDAANFYFERDNSKEVCVEIGSNTITTSGAARIVTAAAVTSSTLPATTTANSTLGVTFCTIQQAIDFKGTVTGDTITVNPATYNEVVTVNKSVAIIGTGTTSSDVVLDAPATPYSATAGTGFAVSVSNVYLKKIKVTNFNLGVSTTVAAATNLTMDSVSLTENFGAGFYSTVTVDSLAITNSILSYNGNKPGFPSSSTLKRGIYLSTGPIYNKIKFDNNIVDSNGIAGIEISSVSTTTSIDGITITNNTVRNNVDAQISTWLGTANPLKKAILISNNTIVLSDTARYGIELRNPAGNGQSSGTGSVVVSDNIISVVNHTGNSRDMAAIAVVRRKEGSAQATMNDQPQGVVVSGNTISDFQNPGAGDAYGIVFGGIGHKVFGNTISNTEFPIQLQKGNTNFASNVSTPNLFGQANDAYFDRDNSKYVCVEIGSNTITTSGAPRLTTGAAATSLTLPAKTTTNTSIGETFCSIQQAIDFQSTVTGNTITVDAGTYDEQVTINKGLIIDGVDSTNRIATFTGVPASTNKSVFTVTAQNVTIKNFKFIVDLTKIYSAILTSGNASGLLITGNTLLSDNPLAGTLLAPYANRNAININIAGAASFTGMTGVVIKANTVNALADKFRAGVAADGTSGLTVGGNNVSDGNNFLASINHDAIIKSYYGSQTVKNNIFNGGGVEVSTSAGNGAFIVSNNTFDGTYAHTINSAMVRIFTNSFPTRTIDFSYNNFINQKWSVSFENTRNVTLDHNDITAAYDSFRLISVNTKLRQTASPGTLETIDIKLTNNNLSATTGLTKGNALEFLNFDQRAANNYINGNYVIGEIGNENNFNANIPTFIKVSNLNGVLTTTQPFLDSFPEYSGVQYTSTTGYWTRDIFARHNRYFVNGSLKLASALSASDFNAVYTQIFDRQDDINIGAVVLMPTWSGAIGTDWNTDSNWSYNFVPAAGLDAVIYPQINKPILSANAACDTIILSNGMTVTTGTYNLTVFGNVRSNGIIYGALGSIILGGNATQILSGSVIVKDLTLDNAAGAMIAPGDTNTVIVSGIYTPTQGVLTTNDNLVLKSDSTGTANVGVGSSGGGYITGKVIVERYLSARKAWRLLSVPTNTAQTVKETWQEGNTGNGSNLVAGYGIQITGAGGTAAGFDLYSATPSMKTYNPATNTWVGIANTSAMIKATDSYMTFVRGDRTANAFNSIPTPTVLRTKGDLYTGDLAPVPVNPDKFAAIGNPYASALDMRFIAKTGIKDFFYLWDPKLSGIYGLGAYQTFSYNGSNYEITPGMGSYGASGSVSDSIQSGQAFFVQATPAGGSVTFSETSKTDGSMLVSRPARASGHQLRTNLYGVYSDGSAYMADGVFINYDDNYTNGIDDMDAIKSVNTNENLSIKNSGSLLVIERRHSIVQQDTIFLNLNGVKAQPYRFEFIAGKLDEPGMNAFLEDRYLNTKTPLNLNGKTIVNFTIVNIPGSYATNRFQIVFAPARVLPLSFTDVKAYQKNTAINVEWKVENESNIKQYEVERSADGNSYIRVNTTIARNTPVSNYSWPDANAAEGYNYYRIKSLDINGKTEYSKVVKVFIKSAKQEITVYPNPIKDGIINLQMVNQPEGAYEIELINSQGQILLKLKMQHAEEKSTEKIIIDKGIARGIYSLEIKTPNNKIITNKLVY